MLFLLIDSGLNVMLLLIIVDIIVEVDVGNVHFAAVVERMIDGVHEEQVEIVA